MFREVIGGLAAVLALVSYVPYVADIFKGKTKPHAISWGIWSALLAIYLLAAVHDHAGPGVWQLGITTLMCALIFVLSLRRGEKQIFRSDWLCLLGAAIAGMLWWITNDPLVSILLVTAIDFIAFVPTFRKSFHKPHQETLSTHWVDVVKHGLSLTAMANYSLVTTLYPSTLFVMNLAFAVLLTVRRKQLGLHPQPHRTEAEAFV